MQHGYYRPAAMARFLAGSMPRAPLAVACAYAGGGDGESTFMPYAIPEKAAVARDAKHHVRTGPWRSVLNSATASSRKRSSTSSRTPQKKDPFEFRRHLMTDHPRFKTVLERVAAMANWGSPLPPREGRGIAITEGFGSIVGEVAHVMVSPDGVLKVKTVSRPSIAATSSMWIPPPRRWRAASPSAGRGVARCDYHCRRQGRGEQLPRLPDADPGRRAGNPGRVRSVGCAPRWAGRSRSRAADCGRGDQRHFAATEFGSDRCPSRTPF